MDHSSLVTQAFAVFAEEAAARPTVTLRAGNEIDEYRSPSSFDGSIDVVSDDYLERFSWGVGYLDAASWRHYLPHLIEYALRNLQQGNGVTDALLNSLRPPDREPPRLASLSPATGSLGHALPGCPGLFTGFRPPGSGVPGARRVVDPRGSLPYQSQVGPRPSLEPPTPDMRVGEWRSQRADVFLTSTFEYIGHVADQERLHLAVNRAGFAERAARVVETSFERIGPGADPGAYIWL